MRTLLGKIVLFRLTASFWLSECNCDILTVKNINSYIARSPHKPFVGEAITKVQPEALELYDESVLNMNFNHLRYLPSDFFNFNPSYEKVRFKLNFIRNVSSRCFLGLGNLTEVDLSYNQLEVIRAGLFKANLKLKVIYLNHNMKLKTIRPDAFHNLRDLRYLYLQYNQLKDFDMHEIVNSKKLRRLFLNNNKLREIEYLVFKEHFHDLQLFALGENMFNCSYKNEAEAFVRRVLPNTVKLSISCIILINQKSLPDCNCNEKSPKPPKVEQNQNLLPSRNQVLPKFYDEKEMRKLISHHQQVERRADAGKLHRNAQMLSKR